MVIDRTQFKKPTFRGETRYCTDHQLKSHSLHHLLSLCVVFDKYKLINKPKPIL